MLHNVRIKVEAFDALDLPFDIMEGTIGRLAVQASAGICSSDPLVHSHRPSCGTWGGVCQAQDTQDKHNSAEACTIPYVPHSILAHHLCCAPAGMPGLAAGPITPALQFPWGVPFAVTPLIVEVEDVHLLAAPRPEEHWCGEHAAKRAAAIKQAALASGPLGPAPAPSRERRSTAPSFSRRLLAYALQWLANRLELTVRNVVLIFQVSISGRFSCGACFLMSCSG